MLFDIPSTINELPSKVDFEKETDGYRLKLCVRIGLNAYWRSRASEAQNHRCCWCGIVTTDERGKKNSSTLEHVTPTSLGGVNHPDNFAMACARCNGNRGSRPVEEFMAALKNGSDSICRMPLDERKYNKAFAKLKAMEAVLKNKKVNPFGPNSQSASYFNKYAKLEVKDIWYQHAIADMKYKIDRKFPVSNMELENEV